MQKFAAAQIHEGFLQMLQVLVRHMVLVPCLAVDGSLHKGLLGHIQFSQAVDYDMYMNVAAAIVTVHVRTDQCLMPRKICFCVFQPKLLCPFPRQTIFCAVPWIKADDVMVAFDFIVSVVLVILLVQQFAFKVKGFGITVQSLKVKFIPEHHIPVFIKDRNQMKFIMLVFQIVDGTPVIGIFTCDVF